MKTLLLVASLFAGATAWTRDATTGCITFESMEAFDKTVDYFPHKTEVQHATKWDVTYNKFYKTATVKSTVTYQLLQCFTDTAEQAKAVAELPACALPNCKRLTIPTTKVALGENSKVLGFLEELQEVKSVKYAYHPSVSPCLQSLSVGTTNPDDAAQAAAVEVFFLDANDAATADTAKHVKLALREETSPRGRAAWVLFVSLFYNKEGLANYVLSRTVVAYDAQVALAVALPKIKYAWVDSFAGGKIKFTSSVYVRSLVTAAGGELVHFGESISAADAAAQLKLVDAVIISDTNRHTSMTAVRALLGVEGTDFRVNKGNGVYNIYQIDRFRSAAHTFVYWEEEVSSSPDLFLSDVMKSARTVTPWTSAFYMFVRRVSDSPALVASKSFFCDRFGLHGRSNAKEIRKTALSKMKQVASNPTGTVTAVAGTDYFPDKSDELLHAELFDIEYHLTWKFVRNHKENANMILIQKGTTPPPANILPDAKRFQIPVDTITATETPTTAFHSVLGNVPKLKYTYASTDPCVAKGIADKTIKEITWPYNAVEGEKNDVILGTAGVTGIKTSTKGAIVSATSDPGPLHRSEWINVHAAFTNSEKKANEIFAEIRSRYLCVAQKGKSASATLGRTPLLAWVGKSYTQPPLPSFTYRATIAQYKIDLAEHAGGLVAASVAGSKMVQHGTTIASDVHYTDAAALHRALEDVDVLIDEHWYGSGVVPQKAAVYEKLGLTDENAKNFKFIKNQALYRQDRSLTSGGGTDVFIRYVTQPDAVVEDLITALHPGWEPSNTAGTHFLRNILKGETHRVPNIADCKDPSAPEPLLTRRSVQCFVPCSERTDRDYCKLDCVVTELTGGSILCSPKTAAPAPLTPVPGAPETNTTNAPGTTPTGTPTTPESAAAAVADVISALFGVDANGAPTGSGFSFF